MVGLLTGAVSVITSPLGQKIGQSIGNIFRKKKDKKRPGSTAAKSPPINTGIVPPVLFPVMGVDAPVNTEAKKSKTAGGMSYDPSPVDEQVNLPGLDSANYSATSSQLMQWIKKNTLLAAGALIAIIYIFKK